MIFHQQNNDIFNDIFNDMFMIFFMICLNDIFEREFYVFHHEKQSCFASTFF